MSIELTPEQHKRWLQRLQEELAETISSNFALTILVSDLTNQLSNANEYTTAIAETNRTLMDKVSTLEAIVRGVDNGKNPS